MIKAVYFDVGSTLIAPCPDIDGMLYKTACERGHTLCLHEVSRHLPAVNALYEERYRTNGDFWCSREGAVGMYLDMYRYFSQLTGLDADAEGIAHAVYRSYLQPSSWTVFDDVLSCLEVLQCLGLRLGVVSNWAPNLEELLSGLGMGSCFEEVVASATVGCRKPDPAIFKVALAHMGIAPHEAVHVGDRPDTDGSGASGAGLVPVIIDRHDRWGDCGFTRIASLADLPGLIAAL